MNLPQCVASISGALRRSSINNTPSRGGSLDQCALYSRGDRIRQFRNEFIGGVELPRPRNTPHPVFGVGTGLFRPTSPRATPRSLTATNELGRLTEHRLAFTVSIARRAGHTITGKSRRFQTFAKLVDALSSPHRLAVAPRIAFNDQSNPVGDAADVAAPPPALRRIGHLLGKGLMSAADPETRSRGRHTGVLFAIEDDF